MKFIIFSLAAILAVTAATPTADSSSPALERRADPILEFDCKDFPNVCKTQCYGEDHTDTF
jgi:hypothetical protein